MGKKRHKQCITIATIFQCKKTNDLGGYITNPKKERLLQKDPIVSDNHNKALIFDFYIKTPL